MINEITSIQDILILGVQAIAAFLIGYYVLKPLIKKKK